MKSTILTMLAVSALCAPTTASAQTVIEWMTLAAIPTRDGSISATGPERAIHLRWDVTEGSLPAGLTSFEVVRDGALVATVPYAVADLATIEAAYMRPENDRRRAEVLAWLWLELGASLPTHEGAYVTGTPAPEPDPTELAGYLPDLPGWIHDKLTTDTYWAHFASRIDPTLAELRGLGWRDTAPPCCAAITYRLDGVLAATATEPERRVVLGETTVEAGLTWSAPAAVGFLQIPARDLARCDAPEAMKAHGVVALDWELPGASAPERFGLAMAMAGFDLYRTAEPVAALQLRDLAAEAALLAHDALGRVPLAGLVRVTDQPILLSADPPETESTYEGFAPRAARYLQTLVETTRSGMRPGERYGYYLVSRDVTGNYGATASLLVEVPDLLAPPAPWSVRAERRVASYGATLATSDDLPDQMVLRWPHVDLLNFVDDHRARTYCNLEDAKLTRELSFVGEGPCPDPGRGFAPAVSLRTAHYDIYRFDSPAEAARFSDSDGDGVADLAERATVGDPTASPPVTSIGSACDPDVEPAGAVDRKVATVPAAAAVPRKDGRLELLWAGTVPAEDAGKVFWYRVATVTESGARSPLSAPVRALFPAYRRTPKRVIDPPEQCDYSVHLGPCGQGDVVATDPVGAAVTVRYTCGTRVWSFPLDGAGAAAGGESRRWTAGECGDNGDFNEACVGENLEIEYLDAQGNVVASTTVPQFSNWQSCVCATLTGGCFDPPPQTLPGALEQVPYDPATECIAVYRKIGERLQRVEVSCDPLGVDATTYYDTDLLGGTVCLYTAAHGPNGALTPKIPLGCEDLGALSAEVPQIAGLSFPTPTSARLSIIPPEQPVLGFIAELSRADGSERMTTFVQLGDRGPLGEVSEDVTLSAMPAGVQSEQWCLRGRTVVARDGTAPVEDALSDWSPSLCAFRVAAGVPAPRYLPWPTQAVVPEGEPLAALYMQADGVPIVHLASYNPCTNGGTLNGFAALCNGNEIDAPCLWPIAPLETQECTGGCSGLRGRLLSELGFVAYRQGRPNSLANSTDFVQVSPLIEHAHCVGVTEDDLPDELDLTWSNTWGPTLDVLIDPYIGFGRILDLQNGQAVEPWDGPEIFFVDRYPHIAGWQYRYQFVWFDTRGEPKSYRTSDWIEAR